MGKRNTKHEEEEPKSKKPSLIWLLTEGARASIEYGLNIPYSIFNEHKNTGDGHPVLVLPGFMTTDYSTRPLRRFIEKCGYTSYGWELGRNYAKEQFIDDLVLRIEELYVEHKQKISLIGWSLGGIYARQLAKERPNLIRQIITLGSPFKSVHRPNHALWMYKILTNGQGVKSVDPELLADIPLPAPVPTTAIYSKQDGIVPWGVCIEDEDEIHENIEVMGSHIGLGVNNTVLDIIADRLKYSMENWVHYKDEKESNNELGLCAT